MGRLEDGKTKTRKEEDRVYDPNNMEAITHDDVLRDETVLMFS
jgi:hypothetical protein